MKALNFQTTMLALVTAILCFNMAVAFNGYRSIERQNKIRTEYSRLRSGILYTNLRIRDAALSNDTVSLEDEVNKINPVRKESLDALDFFRKEQHTFEPEQRVITARILVERMEYRNIQNKLLTHIRNSEYQARDPRAYVAERWKLLQQYNLLMVEYIDKCDALITLSNISVKRAQDKALAMSLLSTGMSLLLVMTIMVVSWWRRK